MKNWGAGHDIWFLQNSDTWLLGTQGGAGFLRTTDGGGTWTQVVTDSSMAHGGSQLYQSPSGDYYLATSSGVIRSTDAGVSWAKIGPGGAFILSVIGDGKLLYTGRNNSTGAFLTAPEGKSSPTWTDYNSQQFGQGPFEMAFDAANGILYTSNMQEGIWALKVK
jgi:photosystem II stability/assembly factor-like uncharacterized protein